jgi:hypothetical protein
MSGTNEAGPYKHATYSPIARLSVAHVTVRAR